MQLLRQITAVIFKYISGFRLV